MSKVSPNHEVKRTMTGRVKYVDAFPSCGRRLLPNDNYGRILQCRITCLQSSHDAACGIADLLLGSMPKMASARLARLKEHGMLSRKQKISKFFKKSECKLPFFMHNYGLSQAENQEHDRRAVSQIGLRITGFQVLVE